MTGTDPASHRDRQRIVLRLAELGVPTTDTEGQRHVVAVWTKGAAQKRSELTAQEAGSLWARLREMGADDVAAVLAIPRPERPADPDPSEVCPEFGASTCRARPGRCCMETPAAEPTEVVEHLADVVPLRPADTEPAPEPAPPVPVVVDVEQAAQEAVERHYARVAAGTPPVPPSREEIPPRVPIVLPPNPNRMCPPACCYCGECPTYKPAVPFDYSKVPGSIAYEEVQRWCR